MTTANAKEGPSRGGSALMLLAVAELIEVIPSPRLRFRL